jgi:maltose-binding protein MalE
VQENFLPFAFAAIPLIVLNVGCTPVNLSTPVSTRSVESETIAAPTVQSTPASLAPQPSGAITLTVWTIEDFSPSSNAWGVVWRDQFAAFRSANPDISPNVILKKADGKGGMLDSLMSTRSAAPTLLPDVAIVSASDAWVLSDAKILQPLNGVLSNDLANGLYPFANQYSVVSQWISIPFAADVQHLVYNQAAVSPVPRTWDDLARQKSTILLPLGNDDGFLLQYLAFGASINNFDTTAATQIFGFIKRGREIGFLSDSALTVNSADDAWNAFASSQVPMAQVSASRYWSSRDRLPGALNTAFAPVPTRDGRTASLARAWAFVIPTSDPRKRGRQRR